MKNCINCGAELTDDMAFCPNCGTATGKDTAERSEPIETSDQPIKAQMQPTEAANDKGAKDEVENEPPKAQKKSKILTAAKVLLIINAVWIPVSAVLTVTGWIIAAIIGSIVSIPAVIIPVFASIVESAGLENIFQISGESVIVDWAVLFTSLGVGGIIVAVILIIALAVMLICFVVWAVFAFIRMFVSLKLVGKIKKSTSKKTVKGWAIACIVVCGLGVLFSVDIFGLVGDIIGTAFLNMSSLISLLKYLPNLALTSAGLVGGILALAAKNTEYEKPKK